MRETTCHNGGASTTAVNNPYTYRGYYYDSDLGMYYLQSRYYDSNICRFISSDITSVIAASPMSLTDKNLFAYCDNNPVMRVDYTGEFWNFIIGGVIGAITGSIVAALNGEDLAGIIIGTIAGAASGVVAASGLGLVAQAGVSAGISVAADFTNQTIDIVQSKASFTDYDIVQTVSEAAIGFTSSALGTTMGNIVDAKITKNLTQSNGFFNEYLEKTFNAGLRKEVGKSTSALIRQASKALKQSDFYLNLYRGISSGIGSVISLLNVAR